MFAKAGKTLINSYTLFIVICNTWREILNHIYRIAQNFDGGKIVNRCYYFSYEGYNQFVKVLLVKLPDLLDSSNFIRLLYCQSFALYGKKPQELQLSSIKLL